MCAQPIRVRDRNHFVVDAIDHKDWMTNLFRSEKRSPEACSHSRKAAICAWATAGPEAGSRSSLRCMSLLMKAVPAPCSTPLAQRKSSAERRILEARDHRESWPDSAYRGA